MRVIEHVCRVTNETDMIALLCQLRGHPAIHVHGPEHHVLVPAIMVATYRNLGGEFAPDALRQAVDRGAKVPGGFCAFAGACGAATGVGIGLSVLLGATPLTPSPRQLVLRAVATVTHALAEFDAARCCQRDCTIALREAAAISAELLPVALVADAPLACEQVSENRECIGEACPLYDP